MDYEQRLHILLRMGKIISHETDIDRLLQQISDLAIEIVAAERCSIFLYDRENNEVWLRLAHGLKEIRIPADRGIVGAAIQSREVQNSLDHYNDIRFYHEVDGETGFQTRSLLAVPMFDKKNHVLGVIEVINKLEGHFCGIDAELMVLLAGFIATTIENAVLQQKIRDAQTGMILRLSTAAEFKDEETSLHTRRVAYYSALIAEALGLSSHQVDAITLTAPMHDVGKIGIPDDIIRKPARLTAEEFEQIKTHTTIGYKILADSANELLDQAAIIARDHHEKWAGGGYPDGKSGEEISLDGRIVAIADVFDALTSVRPYKQAWSLDRAFDLLVSERDNHFQGELIDLFVENRSRVETIHHTYREETAEDDVIQ